MKVCPNCFADKEIMGFISSSSEIGDCIICGSKDQNLMDVTELLDFFQELVDCFQIKTKGEPLNIRIQGQWKFFTSIEVTDLILNFVLPKLKTVISSPKEIVDYIDEIIDNYSYWDVLKDELKWKNRFVINIERLQDLGWDGFFNTQFRLYPDTQLYRARLHHQSGLPYYATVEMICPPKEKAGGGRANPLGIPYLYLSDNSETVLYEVRASYLDELSLGTFRLKSAIGSINLVDFNEDTSLYPSMGNKVNEIIKSKLLREAISLDLSKPMRRYDSELEYIPTQFICEFIKVYTGAEGIRFRSSLHLAGNNIVIFDQDLFECESVKLMKIGTVNMNAIEIV